MRQPLYKTFGSIELNPALKAAGWLAGYRRVGVCFCAMHFGHIRGNSDIACQLLEARTKNHRQTELWLYLPKERRPPKAFAQRTIATVVRETYLLFARRTAIISIVLWTIALSFSVIGL
jgi:hypothetical protein